MRRFVIEHHEEETQIIDLTREDDEVTGGVVVTIFPELPEPIRRHLAVEIANRLEAAHEKGELVENEG